MRPRTLRQRIRQYQPETWREDETPLSSTKTAPSKIDLSKLLGRLDFVIDQGPTGEPTVREQTKLLDLIGKINFKIIKGKRVYIEVGGVVYKTLYGGYWRSVFTGVEHYLFRCEQVSGCVWADDSDEDPAIDLPIVYSNEGWTASGHSLSFMLE